MVRSGPSRRCARASGQSALGIELNYRQGHEAKVVDHTLLPAVCRRKIDEQGDWQARPPAGSLPRTGGDWSAASLLGGSQWQITRAKGHYRVL